MIRIMRNKKYKKLLSKIELLELELRAVKKNYEHRDNIAHILEKTLANTKNELAMTQIQLEDVASYLEQEKEVSSALRKERANLRRKITILEKELNPCE